MVNMKLVKIIAIFLLIQSFFGNIGFAQEREQYVILVSLDGFRYDYLERFKPDNLSRFAQNGVSAEAMIPSFPTKTFPNHYTIATGLKPENHGLVNNSFYDPDKDQIYKISDRDIVEDGTWYGGTPLWVLAQKNGVKAASYFFVGSEAPVQGVRPSYYFTYDGNVPNLTRISKVFEWLQMPDEERPRLITLYFSDMDDIGHRFGPGNDEEIGSRLERLDRELGALIEGVKSFDLDINLIFVSDHGMADVPKKNLIDLDKITEGIDAMVVNNGALAHLYLTNPKDTDKVLKKMNRSTQAYKVVKVGEREYYKNLDSYGDRMGEILVIPDLGHYLATASGMVSYQNRSARFKTDVFGEHGYSPDHKEMHAIFYAQGPMLKSGYSVPPFENIHVYPLVCTILNLPIPDGIDGRLEVLESVLIAK